MPIVTRFSAHVCGVSSLIITAVFWISMRYAQPLSNVYVVFVGVPFIVAASLILAVIAFVRASRWWALALVVPLMTLIGLLAVKG